LVLKATIPSIIGLKPFIREYLQIDILDRLMPAMIKVGGIRDDFNVFLSTISKYPNEESNQGRY
jgi:hypothetical protein